MDLEKYVLRFLGIRPRSQFEMQQRLKQRGYLDVDIKKVIKKLKNEGLLDDSNFAELWVHNRHSLKPKGKRLLNLELRQKGISEKIIEKVLDYSDDQEIKLAQKVLSSKLKMYQNIDKWKLKQKLLAFLSRRGFSYDVSAQAIEKYI